MRSPGAGSGPTWLGGDPHNPQTLHLGSHVHSLQGDMLPDLVTGVTWSSQQVETLPNTVHVHVHRLQVDHPPRLCTWGHMFTVFNVTPSCTLGHRSRFQGDIPPKTLHLGLHVHYLQGDNNTPDYQGMFNRRIPTCCFS